MNNNPFKVLLDPRAISDIQAAIDYYEGKSKGLGRAFEAEFNQKVIVLSTNPFFQTLFKNVRCLPLRKFPFNIHFTVNEETKTVMIRAVFHTAGNPQKWD